jgi:tetratricopeptide (TPR) repeat protein
VLGALLFLASLTTLFLGERQRRPYLAVGWLWFLGTLVPVIGLVQVGAQGRADRFTYVPHIGLFILLVWGAADLLKRWPRPVVAALTGVVLAGCVLGTVTQLPHWRNSYTLWEQALRADPSNARAYAHLGMLHMQREDEVQANEERAAAYLRRAVEHAPNVADYHYLLGVVLFRQKQFDEAEPYLARAAHLGPGLADTHYRLGQIALHRGQPDRASAHLAAAQRLNPGTADELNAQGLDLCRRQQWPQAGHYLEQAVGLQPGVAEFRANLALALYEQGERAQAELEYRQADRLNPDWARQAAAAAWHRATHPEPDQRQAAEAVRLARQACQATEFQEPRFLDILAASLAEAGQFEEAVRVARQAVERARAGGQMDLAKEIERRLTGYVGGQPFRAGPERVEKRLPE